MELPSFQDFAQEKILRNKLASVKYIQSIIQLLFFL